MLVVLLDGSTPSYFIAHIGIGEQALTLSGGVLGGYFDGTDFSEINWLREKEKVQPTRSIG